MISLLWIGFCLLVLGLLALDLGVFNRKAHEVSFGEAIAWTAFWIALALGFNVGVYFLYENHWLGIGARIGHELTGAQAALQFLTGYVIEKSLSLDNIFVIALILGHFKVPLRLQHRVLFWGILGALVLRGLMIAAGAALIDRFDWIVYVFGALLIATAVKLMISRHETLDLERSPLVRLARRLYPVASDFDDARFFTRLDGRRAITPLFLALLVVEGSDVMFAVDSIPAIFAVTRDPFLVFTSNVFAILGLRSLYFALAAVMHRFRYLKMSLVFILSFVGVKMLLAHHHPIPTPISLAVIVGMLAVGVLASLASARIEPSAPVPPLGEDFEALAALTWRHARKITILIVGGSLLIVGGVLCLIPGPGLPVIVLALIVLATEFYWARRWLNFARERAKRAGESLRRFKDKL